MSLQEKESVTHQGLFEVKYELKTPSLPIYEVKQEEFNKNEEELDLLRGGPTPPCGPGVGQDGGAGNDTQGTFEANTEPLKSLGDVIGGNRVMAGPTGQRCARCGCRGALVRHGKLSRRRRRLRKSAS
jgi:hypothetical protein